MPFERELEAARAAASRAGELALRYFRTGVAAEDKPDDSPVTVADRESEKLIVAVLSEAFPADGFLGEEGTSRVGTSGRRWIIDPIDGTRDFVRGNRLWCNLIGLEDAERVVVGVATFPALNNQYWAVLGEGAWRVEGMVETQIRCSTISDPQRAVVCMNQLNHVLEYPRSEKVLPYLSKFWSQRSLGGALDAMMVAAGSAEVWMEPSLKPWDLAAISLIAKESGCRFFDYKGVDTIYGGDGVICVPGLEAQVKEFLEVA